MMIGKIFTDDFIFKELYILFSADLTGFKNLLGLKYSL